MGLKGHGGVVIVISTFVILILGNFFCQCEQLCTKDMHHCLSIWPFSIGNKMKRTLIPPLLETDLKSAALTNKPRCHSVGVWALAPPWVGTSGSGKGSVILARAESRQDVCICYLQPSPGSRQRWRDITTTQSYLHEIVLLQPGSPDLGTLSCPPETGSDFWT